MEKPLMGGGSLTEQNLLHVMERLRVLLDGAVQRNLAACILLSGGLDTSILTAVASEHTKLTGITVSLGDAPDVKFASLIAEKFGLRHIIVRIDNGDIQLVIPEVVRVMQSFDPMEIRNDATILAGLRNAKQAGFNTVMTGDAGDELFAGYSFFFNMSSEALNKRLREIWRTMRFSSVPLAENLGMTAKLPLLDDELKSYAMKINAQLKIRAERGRTYGKWILRKSFEHELPEEIIWREKMPIEQGSGTSSLPEHYAKRIPDSEFSRKRQMYTELDGVRLRDKEQLAYYEAYRAFFGTPAGRGDGTKLCRGCSTHLPETINYCRTCGEYPA
jgi:asparagine synthase (glutamine-hydrolysing)